MTQNLSKDEIASKIAELEAETAKLAGEAQKIKDELKAEVAASVIEMIALHQLKYEDLFGKAKRRRGPNKSPAPAYRDAAGNKWMGRGRKPAWLNAQIAAGTDIEQFRI